MAEDYLASAVADVPALDAVLVTVMPDCLLYESWRRKDSAWSTEELASYFGDLVRANRQALKTLGSWSADMQVTIESADAVIILKEMRADFVGGFVFDKAAPLGMVRLHVRRMLDRIEAHLPQLAHEERPRGVRIVEFLERYAPDPHAVLLRAALRANIPIDDLRHPEKLSSGQVQQLEEVAQRILGLAELNV